MAELTTAVENFDGTLLGILPESLQLLASDGKVYVATKETTAVVESSSNFTMDESLSIVESLAGLITPINGSLNALVAKVSRGFSFCIV